MKFDQIGKFKCKSGAWLERDRGVKIGIIVFEPDCFVDVDTKDSIYAFRQVDSKFISFTQV